MKQDKQALKELDEKILADLKAENLEKSLALSSQAQTFLDNFKSSFKEAEYLEGSQRKYRFDEVKKQMLSFLIDTNQVIRLIPQDYQNVFKKEFMTLFEHE